MGEGQDPDNAELQSQGGQPAPGEQFVDAPPGLAEGGEQPAGGQATGEPESWSKEGQAIFTRMNQKLSEGFKELGEQMAGALRETRPEPPRPAAPPQAESPYVPPEGVDMGMTDELYRHTPSYIALKAGLAEAQARGARNAVEMGLMTQVEDPLYERVAPDVRAALQGVPNVDVGMVRMAYDAASAPLLRAAAAEAVKTQTAAEEAERQKKGRDGFSAPSGGVPSAAQPEVSAMTQDELAAGLDKAGFFSG